MSIVPAATPTGRTNSGRDGRVAEHSLQVLGDQHAHAGHHDPGSDQSTENDAHAAEPEQAQVQQRALHPQLTMHEQRPDRDADHHGRDGDPDRLRARGERLDPVHDRQHGEQRHADADQVEAPASPLENSGSTNGPTTSTIAITGTASRNTLPHQKCSRSTPPRTGPSAAPPNRQVAQIEMATPRWRSSPNMFVISARVEGMRVAPAIPSRARAPALRGERRSRAERLMRWASVMAAFAELERDLIYQRTMAGLAAARAHGRVGGRPTVMNPDKIAAATARLARGERPTHVARALGVSRATLYRDEWAMSSGSPPTPTGAAAASLAR